MNTPNDPKGAVGALKTPLGLIPSYAMEAVSWAHKLGAEKYGPFNWRNTGVCASTYINAMMRHLNAWRDGEDLDPESGISHLAHIACNCNILLDADYCDTLQDDRNKVPSNCVEPEPVYQFLQTGEVMEDGDEFLYEGTESWHEIPDYFVGLSALDCYRNQTRRKIEPEPEPVYRELRYDEIIEEGDEYYIYYGDQWVTTTYAGQLVGNMDLKYRRLIKQNQADPKCKCGGLLINHFTLGPLCEECELTGQDPY